MLLDRRKYLTAVWVALAAAVARAQSPPRRRRIGFLGYTATNTPDDERDLAALRQRLRELGLVEGENLIIDWRYGEGRLDRYDALATELVALGVEAIVVTSGTAARAVMRASARMPVVTVAVPDPVRSGLVASLGRPGGQVTGVSNLSDDLTPKRLELLKTAVPTATRIGIARCPRCVLSAGESVEALNALYASHDAAARSLGVRLIPMDLNESGDFAAARETVQRERPEALLINATQINVSLRREWMELAAARRLPTMAPYRGFGAMLSYGPDSAAIMRNVAEYVARILGGESPADLPMAQPTRFELVINLRAASAAGIKVPQELLARADEVVE